MPRVHFLFCLLLLMTAGCAPTALELMQPPHYAGSLSRSPYPVLKDRIDALIPDSLFPPSNIGMKVVSLKSGQVWYSLNSAALFNPASNQKLFTGATALALLGPSFPLTTAVSIDTVVGIIRVRGHGDPLMQTADIDSLAGLIMPHLPPRKYWTIVGDVSYFDDEYWGAGWTWDQEPAAYGMFVSPLILNHNTVSVQVQPGAAAGELVHATVTPRTSHIGLRIRARTVADSVPQPLVVTRNWRERSNIITVEGEMPLLGRTYTDDMSVWRPELYFVTYLGERLQSRGVPVTGAAVENGSGNGAATITYSHLLDSALTFTEKVSDNLGAEALLKIVAAEKTGRPGSAENGIHVMNAYLTGIGIDTTKIAIADGSGLSRYNLSSPDAVVRLLTAVHADSSNFRVFHRALPIAGVDGTIGRRMRGTSAEANLRAKTGTLSAVTALSGYVTTADGELLAFSIMMQNFTEGSRAYRGVQDRIGGLLGSLTKDQLR